MMNTFSRGSILFGLLFLVMTVYPGAALDHESYRTVSGSVTTRKELQLKFTQSFRFPLLAGQNPLTRDNNLLVNLSGDISPVSINGNAAFILTPVAFLQLVTGGGAGTGWNIPFVDGLRINEPGRNPDGTLDGTNTLTGDSLNGIVWRVHGGVVFQFDFAAIKPGDWNHVVFRTSHKMQYQALTTAGGTDSWVWENGDGESRNGWVYYGEYLLGYQLPMRFSFLGILVLQEKNLYKTPGRLYWGDDISRWTFGLVGVYSLSPTLSLSAMVQGRTIRRFEGNTGSYDFYQLRNIDRDNPRKIVFYRAGFSLEKRLK